MMLMMSSSYKDGLITNLMSLGNVDITALIIPVEEYIPTVSGAVVVEEELCASLDQTLNHKLSTFHYRKHLIRKYSLETYAIHKKPRKYHEQFALFGSLIAQTIKNKHMSLTTHAIMQINKLLTFPPEFLVKH